MYADVPGRRKGGFYDRSNFVEAVIGLTTEHPDVINFRRGRNSIRSPGFPRRGDSLELLVSPCLYFIPQRKRRRTWDIRSLSNVERTVGGQFPLRRELCLACSSSACQYQSRVNREHIATSTYLTWLERASNHPAHSSGYKLKPQHLYRNKAHLLLRVGSLVVSPNSKIEDIVAATRL